MKILCLDGGGMRGIFSVVILQRMEEMYNKPISEQFDVIAGTSTGAIIAASVAMKIKMEELLYNYEVFGRKIFSRQAKVGWFKSVYSDRYLRLFFQKVFGHTKLLDIDQPLLIPAVNLTKGKPYVHRSNYGNWKENDPSIELWDAVLSSCSAPVYFPPNNIQNRYLSIDGGLWANNPSLVCVTEALHHFNKTLDDIQIMSIGTGQQSIDFSIDEEKWGINKWLPFDFPSMKVTPKLLDLALHLSSESVTYHCELMLGKNYLRLNEELGGEVPFDEVKYNTHLKALGEKVIQEKTKEIMEFIEK